MLYEKLKAIVYMPKGCYIIPFKKFVEKRGKGLGMLNMYREVSRDRDQSVISIYLASQFIMIITGGAIGLEQQ